MTYARPRIIKTPLTNGSYGYPRGAKRRVEPIALLCLHITGNSRTAGYDSPIEGTRAEVAYMNRPGGDGPSAHSYIARDGTVFQCLNADDHAAWSNGDMTNPAAGYPIIRRLVALQRNGINPNEAFHREIEMTGYPGRFPPTKRQLESVAWLLARDSIKTGLPIKAGETVAIHAWINTINRASCPFGSDALKRIQEVCRRARVIKAEMETGEPPVDPPDEEPPQQDECEAIRDELEAARGAAEALEDERQELLGVLSKVGATVAPYLPDDGDEGP